MSTSTPLPAVIDYTSKDFQGFETSLLAYASLVMPQWTARQAGDFGMLMIDSVSYIGDILSYYQDRIANESYLSTATQRSSVVQLAALIGYTPAPALPATGTVTLVSDPSTLSPITVPTGTQLVTGYQANGDATITFETTAPATVPAAGGTATVAIAQGQDQGTYTITVTSGVPTPTGYLVRDLGQSTGAAGAEFALPTSPVVVGTLAVIVQLPTGPALWTPVPTLLTAGPTDTVYTATDDGSGTVTIMFGDGVNGLIPPSGVTISAAYQVGGGAYGNLPANAITDLATAMPGLSVQSSSATTGGADAESIASVRVNAPRAWRTQQRCVTVADYADAALSLSAVYKASALVSGPGSVTVYALAQLLAAPSSALLAQIVSTLTPRAMAGCTVTAQAGSVVDVNLTCALTVQPTYSRANTTAAVQQALSDLFAPDAVDFGQLMPLSAIYSAIDLVPGVSLVNLSMYARSDLPQTGTADAYFRTLEVPALGTATITATGGI